MLLALAMAVIVAATPDANPKDHKAELRIRTSPAEAEVLVVPQSPFQAYQCSAPCAVRIPQQLGFTVFAIKPGYVQDSATPVGWIRKGYDSYDLTTHEVIIRLRPDVH